MSEPKLKTYRLHWEATIRGHQDVQAEDDQSAIDQFESVAELESFIEDIGFSHCEEIK